MLCTYRKSWNFWSRRICRMWHVLCIFAWGPKLITQFRFRTHSISVGEKQAFDQSQQGWKRLTEIERSFKTFSDSHLHLHCYTMQSAFPKELMYIFLQYKRSASSFMRDTIQNIYLKQPYSTNHIIPYNTNSAQPKAKWSKLQYLSLPPWLACKCEKEWGFYCNRHKQIQCYKWVTLLQVSNF